MFKTPANLKSTFTNGKPLIVINAISKGKSRYPVKTDTGKLSVQHFNAGALKSYQNDKAFNYHTEKEVLTWWDRFWNEVWHLWENFWLWVAHLFEKLFGRVGGHGTVTVLKYIILAVCVTTLVYAILKFFGINLLKLFKKKQKAVSVPYTESIENIHEISFDDAIDDAIANKNYRLTVRLLYLRSLKQLSDKGLINWKMDKTNSAYINELTDNEQKDQFKLITRQFEYVWYGDFPVDGQSFQTINSIFTDFKSRLA